MPRIVKPERAALLEQLGDFSSPPRYFKSCRNVYVLKFVGSLLVSALILAVMTSSMKILHIHGPDVTTENGETFGDSYGSPSEMAEDGNPSAPHVVMITLDDVGMNDVGYTSLDLPLVTPFIDNLAARGVKLMNYYGQSLCTPARNTLMTGRFPHRTGFSSIDDSIEIDAYSNYSLPIGIKLMPAFFKTEGYATYAIGKWNLGHCNVAYLPTSRGFDFFLGYTSPGISYYDHDTDVHDYYTWDNQTYTSLHDLMETSSAGGVKDADIFVKRAGVYSDEIFMEKALDHISQHTGANAQPFFMWLALQAAHDDEGWVVPHSMNREVSENIATWAYLSNLTSRRGSLAGAMSTTDVIVKRIYAALEDLDGDYILVMHSDNGADTCGSNIAGSNLPFRGSKMSFFEGGVKVFAFIYSSQNSFNSIRGYQYYGLMHHVDWIATFLAAIDSSQVLGSTFDSENHWDNILTASVPDGGSSQSTGNHTTRAIVFALGTYEYTTNSMIHHTLFYSIRQGNYKIMHQLNNASWFRLDKEYASDVCLNAGTESNFLFDLASDPYEHVNLYYDVQFTSVREKLHGMALKLHAEQSFTPTYDYSSLTSEDAYRAFNESGGYVAPWGCEVQ